MRKSFFPQTILGRIGLELITLAVLLLALFYVIVLVFDPQGPAEGGFFSVPALAIPLLLAWVVATGAFFCSVVAILFQKERSWWMGIPLLLGAFFLWFGLAEVLWEG